MDSDSALSPLVARRRLSYLATFENKIHALRRGLERVRRVADDATTFSGRLPTDDLERVGRSLVGAGLVYGLNEVTDWANSFIAGLANLRRRGELPTEKDFEWLAAQISTLQDLRDQEIVAARAVAPSLVPAAAASVPSPLGKSGSDEVTEAHEKPEKKEAPSVPRPTKADDAQGQAPAPKKLSSKRSIFSSIASGSPFGATKVQRTAVVVSSDTALCKKVAFTLTHAGYAVGEISVLDTALEVLRTELPDLVLVDMDDQVPGGQYLIDALARDPLTDYIPVLRLVSDRGAVVRNALPKPINA